MSGAHALKNMKPINDFYARPKLANQTSYILLSSTLLPEIDFCYKWGMGGEEGEGQCCFVSMLFPLPTIHSHKLRSLWKGALAPIAP